MRDSIRLSTSEDQKASNLSSAIAMLAQQLPATVKQELGHEHHNDILRTNSRFM
jgi:hypothetical protein